MDSSSDDSSVEQLSETPLLPDLELGGKLPLRKPNTNSKTGRRQDSKKGRKKLLSSTNSTNSSNSGLTGSNRSTNNRFQGKSM